MEENHTEQGKRRLLVPLVVAGIVVIVILAIILTQPRYVKIQATYSGETKAGTVLDKDNSGIVVNGYTEDGKEKELSGWKIEKPVTLENDTRSTVSISYKKLACDLKVQCTDSAIVEIEAEYSGSLEAGTRVDDSSAVTVTEIHKNGSKTESEEWTVKEPVTLEADTTSELVVVSGEFETSLSLECSTSALTGISATYDGETKEGTVLDANNEGIHVTANYKNGTTEEVEEFEVKEAQTLVADSTSTVTITYEGQECTLEVTCSTVSPEKFKASCQSISYEELSRNPDAYKGQNCYFTGEVIQTMESGSTGVLRVNVTQGKYSWSDTVYVVYEVDSSNRILEDDIVTFYGKYMGLYTYTSVMGASITIPEVGALFVDRN